MAYFGILARVHTQQVSEESYSEPELVPRFSLAKLNLEPGYKSGADPVCQAGSHYRNLGFLRFRRFAWLVLERKEKFQEKALGTGKHCRDDGISAGPGSLILLCLIRLRSKRLQSRYCAKVGTRAKEIQDRRGRGRGEEETTFLPSPFIPLFCSCPNSPDELARKSLLRS